MASHPTSQNGQFNMSSHPPQAYHQPAPIPNMEVHSTIPAKRGPENDVQFVSVQPVKKARGSRESLPAQCRQTQDQSIAHPKAQNQGAQGQETHPSNTDAASGPQSDPPISNRDVSFPGLENYVFPPPPTSGPSRTSRSSTVLSPRQLPQPVLPAKIQTTLQPPPGLRGLVHPPQFQIPWGMSGLYPQAAPTNPDVPLSRPTPLPSIQQQYVGAGSATDIDDQPLSMSMASRRAEPQTLRQSGQVPHAEVGSSTPNELEKTAHIPPNGADHAQVKTLPYPSPRQEPQTRAQTPSDPQTRPPTPTVAQPGPQHPANIVSDIHSTVAGPEVIASQQTVPPKGPCVICEQMRQQILSNQANGFPIAHLAQMSHGWHGQGPAPQGHMAHPNPAFGMVPNMLQNLQQRYQTIPLGHLPMGYGMHSIPVHVQMQLQRQLGAPNVAGAESLPVASPQDQQGQQTQCQQAPGQLPHLAPGPPPQYMYSQLPSLAQPVMIQRPLMVHQQALVPPLAPPSPQPSPQATQMTEAPALPEPKKHSPNLIVDIAETCEELFPYDEVAKRHGVTRVKVVETFGAVIQLPLLRCTTDKKRHGKLATNRLREYTKAKKDAEATNAASAAKTKPATSTPPPPPPTPAAPAAQTLVSPQVEADQMSATQIQNHTRQFQAIQTQTMQAQVMQAQALQARAMEAQANQMYVNQGHIRQHPQPPQSGQVSAGQDRNTLPGVFEMANTVSPLGLPSNLSHGLSGHWQQQ